MSQTATNINLTSADEAFKEVYIPAADEALHALTPYNALVSKEFDFTGKQLTGMATLSNGRGFGARVSPYAGIPKYAQPTYTATAFWVSSVIDNEAVAASGNDKGAFLKVTEADIRGCLQFYNDVMEFLDLNDDDGKIGTIDGSGGASAVTSSTDADTGLELYTFTFLSTDYFERIVQPGMVVNFGTNTEPFIIQSINWETRVCVASQHPDYTHSYNPDTAITSDTAVYIQRCKDTGYVGLATIAAATNNGSNTVYGVLVGPRWQPTKVDGGSTTIVVDHIVEGLAKTFERTGQSLTDVIMSYSNYMNLENQLIGRTEFRKLKSSDARYGELGFDVLALRTKYGPVRFVPAAMMPDDKAYLVKQGKEYLARVYRPGMGWQKTEDKGSIYLRDHTEGQVLKAKAVYGGYAQSRVHPAVFCVINNLVPETSAT